MKLTSKNTAAGPLAQLFNPRPVEFGGVGQVVKPIIDNINNDIIVVAECLNAAGDTLVDIASTPSQVRVSTATAIASATAIAEGAEYVTGTPLGARVYSLELFGNDELSDGDFLTGDANDATLIEAIAAMEAGTTNTNLASIGAVVLDQPGGRIYVFPVGADVDSCLTGKTVQESFSAGGASFME